MINRLLGLTPTSCVSQTLWDIKHDELLPTTSTRCSNADLHKILLTLSRFPPQCPPTSSENHTSGKETVCFFETSASSRRIAEDGDMVSENENRGGDRVYRDADL